MERLGQHIGERIVTCGLVIARWLHHQVTGEMMKFLTLADHTEIVETELFASTYRSYGQAMPLAAAQPGASALHRLGQ